MLPFQIAALDTSVAALLIKIVALQKQSGRPFALFLMGDHGPPFPLKYSIPGDWKEERSNPAQWVVSSGLTQGQRETLHANADKRAAHYDVLATVLDLGSAGRRKWGGKANGRGDGNLGRSLVSELLPSKRSCAEAGVPVSTCFEASYNGKRPAVLPASQSHIIVINMVQQGCRRSQPQTRLESRFCNKEV